MGTVKIRRRCGAMDEYSDVARVFETSNMLGIVQSTPTQTKTIRIPFFEIANVVQEGVIARSSEGTEIRRSYEPC